MTNVAVFCSENLFKLESVECIAFKVVTYGQLEQDCLGAWCPVRRIPGLILIHAWNPNDMNTLTSVCGIFIFTINIILFIIITLSPMHNVYIVQSYSPVVKNPL